MNTIGSRCRRTLAVAYAILILLPCLLLALAQELPPAAVAGTFLAYAFALLPTYHLDHWLLGGIGFHSLTIFALFAVIVAVMLWPLPFLTATPAAWHSSGWRRLILGYAAAFIGLATLAAWRMTQSWGLFFG